MKNPFMYLKECVNTDIYPSKIHGVGTFALSKIRAGESMFVRWYGDSSIYFMSKDQYSQLPVYVQRILLKSYENDVKSNDFLWFRLTHGCYFNFANPFAYINAGEGCAANFDSILRVAIRDIDEGDEILGTYTLKNTIL